MRDAIISEAQRWVGTPYRHQATAFQLGCDCVGLIRGVGFNAGVLPPQPEKWKQFNAYGRLPNPARMAEGMRTFLCPVDGTPQHGDIAWLSWRADLPMHLALLARYANGRRTLIHCYSHVGRVVEHGFTAEWRGRVHSWWRYPGVAE